MLQPRCVSTHLESAAMKSESLVFPLSQLTDQVILCLLTEEACTDALFQKQLV